MKGQNERNLNEMQKYSEKNPRLHKLHNLPEVNTQITVRKKQFTS